MNEILQRIEALRARKKMSGNKLCKELNIAQSTYATWFKNDSVPKPDKLQKIADYFNVTLDYLMTGEEKDWQPTISEKEPHLSKSEEAVLKKYSELDAHGREVIDLLLEKEHDRCTAEPARAAIHSIKPSLDEQLNAAHARTDIDLPEDVDTSDDDVMDNDENWK